MNEKDVKRRIIEIEISGGTLPDEKAVFPIEEEMLLVDNLALAELIKSWVMEKISR